MAQDSARQVFCRAPARDDLLADLAARPRIEACGLLLGTCEAGGWWIDATVPLRNTADSATFFEFDPGELLDNDLRYGERIIGVYHSHPGGPVRPSATDRGQMRAQTDAPWVWLILSPHGGAPLGTPPSGWRSAGVGAFRIEDGALVTFPLLVTEGGEGGA